ncbi:MAG TPA: hypothetical protein VM935_17420 [Chitinophagaceae bacterium]|jgi:hypothetical protein|nr:hypothetical protein [Chitinophagaceae bacterium]
MKMKIFKIAAFALSMLLVVGTLVSCKKLAGLERQEDWKFTPTTVDPNIKMSAWEYLKKRATGPLAADTILKRMYEAVVYSEIDTMEYSKAGRTYIFLHNDAVRRLASNRYTTDCYWGRDSVGVPKRPANAWSEYPKDKVKNLLLYLIAEGNHTFETLTPVNVTAKTLAPDGSNPNNPENIMLFRVDNTGSYPIRLNDFIGSTRITTVRTGGILSTNGPIQVVDRIVDYNR